MQVTITKISRKTREGKNGPYNTTGIQTNTHGTEWLGGFENQINKEWKAGDVVDIEVTQNGQYLNYKPIGTVNKSKTKQEAIEHLVDKKGEGMALGNAKTNAVLMAIEAYKKGDIQVDQLYSSFKEWTNRIYHYQPQKPLPVPQNAQPPVQEETPAPAPQQDDGWPYDAPEADRPPF